MYALYEQELRSLVDYAKDTYKCNRPPRPSGALLVLADNRRHVYGSVQPTPGSPSCLDDGCMMVDGHCVRNIHAEVDAIIAAAREGYKTKESILYSINKPCYNCTIAAIKAGVKVIFYAYAVYDEKRTNDALIAAGVQCYHVPIQ